MSCTHELKTWPAPFQAVLDGIKRHEIRVDDRGFAVGDELTLKEWAPSPVGHYTGREIDVRVIYITHGGQWGLPANVCVMSIEPNDWHRRAAP